MNAVRNEFRPHEALPPALHDELTRQAFVVDLKSWIETRLTPQVRRVVDEKIAPLNLPRREAREAAVREPEARDWACMTRYAQEMMWDACIDTIDRQTAANEDRAAAFNSLGSLRLQENCEYPRYLQGVDTHCMPGSYGWSQRANDLRQGALYDMAAMLFNGWRNGGGLNDGRGRTLVHHLRTRFADIEPRRILEMGCTVGHSTVAIAKEYPHSELHAIDVGAGVLRYAHARANALGASVHFAQQNAEATDYPDGHFDLVISCVMFHETSAAALPRIMRETARLLRPGGAFAHLEVPYDYNDLTLWEYVRNENETFCNNEPFWRGSLSTDFAALARAAGLVDVIDGYQSANPTLAGRPESFTNKRGPVFTCWRVVSGRKPD
jgi:SAM-dependent methyltransferase